MITAEMQKVINWLRSDYGDSRALYCPGIMSVKEETHLSAQWSWWPSGNDASNDRKAP
jgi:hypothetical protein